MPHVSPEAHGRFVARLFADIVPLYDRLNSVFSFGIDALWRKALAHAVAPALATPGARVLDLAAGTLKVSQQLLAMYPTATVLGIDFCRPMLEKGLQGFGSGRPQQFLPAVGDAFALPLAAASIDAITVAFGLRNMQPRSEALLEMYRVLRPGGKLCVLELGSTQDKILGGVYNVYLERVMPAVAKLFYRRKGAYRYLAESIAAFPSAKGVAQEMEAAGFQSVTYGRHTAGIVCLHEGVKASS